MSSLRYVAVALAAAVLATAILVAPSTASADPARATLYINRDPYIPHLCTVVVDGHFHTNTPRQDVGFSLKGDDPWFDDHLGIGASGMTWYGDYNLSNWVDCSRLNEDWEGRDELYAKVSISGQSRNTQNVNGYF
jgi:hypothetical protein